MYTIIELHIDFQLTSFLSNSYFARGSFNQAMTSFLSCLEEIGTFAEASDRALRLPYIIDKDKIGGLVGYE